MDLAEVQKRIKELTDKIPTCVEWPHDRRSVRGLTEDQKAELDNLFRLEAEIQSGHVFDPEELDEEDGDK